MILYLLLLLVVLFTVLGALVARRVPVRQLVALRQAENAISAAVESERAVHVALGGVALRDRGTISALAGAELAYQAALRALPGAQPVTISTSDGATLALAQDRLRRAYRRALRPDRYRSTLANWYPSGPLSLAFAAGVGSALLSDDYAANLFVGRFGSELALIADHAARYDRALLAHSDLVEGQAVAYAVATSAGGAALLGEELYATAAHFEPLPFHIGGIVAQDALRYLVVAVLIALAVLTFLGANL